MSTLHYRRPVLYVLGCAVVALLGIALVVGSLLALAVLIR